MIEKNTQSIPYKSVCTAAALFATLLFLPGCKKEAIGDGAPPQEPVTHVSDMSLVTVDPKLLDHFPLKAAEKLEEASQVTATGAVFPDISREIPVISLANGRVVDIKARLDDYVKKGDLLLKVQSPDVSSAYDIYLKASNDEHLASKSYLRAKDLFEHGAIPQSALEQADDTEKDAKADLNAAEENLKTLGVDKDHPSSIINVYAPTSGVIIAQNVTQAAAAGVNLSGSATAFTIADLSHVWIICDVFENDISKIKLGQSAQIHVNAYPDKVLTGHISDIGPVLDPAIRTAKVRIEVANPGNLLKLGMFVNTTLDSLKLQTYTSVPSNAVLHLHDRDWVFVPVGGNNFKRLSVHGGKILPNGTQEILDGLRVGQQVVTNALDLESTVSQ
jgi:cobalt-zinc-cadmium efflux system membrane fusion protein